jgi:transmembrane sensor
MNRERIWTLMSRKFAGEATEAELTELNDLLSADNNILYPTAAVLEEYWTIPLEKDQEFLEATYHLHLSRMKVNGQGIENTPDEETPSFAAFPYPTSATNKKKLYAVSLALALVSVLGFFIYQSGTAKKIVAPPVAMQSKVSTKNGSRSKVQLPDGTSVWLNSNSQLVYDNKNFGENIREVTLIGEGYFDVVKNPDKPFVIHTTRMDIKVLGTAFNVKSYAGEKSTETSLVRGSIEVTLKQRQEKIMLKPNEKLVVSDDDEINSPKATTHKSKDLPTPTFSLGHLSRMPLDSSIVETAWVENRLVFNNETFAEIAIRMERWYGVNIKFADEKLLNIHFTGIFEKETIGQALEAIQLSTAFKYSITKNNILITR